MKLSKLGITVLALALLLVGFGLGRVVSEAQLANAQPPSPSPLPATATPTFTMPTRDVPGRDIQDLPRYPGAIRVEHRRTIQDGLVTVEVEYVTIDELDKVQDFYRNVFQTNGWSVADFNFSQGEWTFFVLDGAREAVVEIESRGSLVEVEIELSMPSAEPEPTAEPATTPQEAPPPAAPVPALPGADDDDDDDD